MSTAWPIAGTGRTPVPAAIWIDWGCAIKNPIDALLARGAGQSNPELDDRLKDPASAEGQMAAELDRLSRLELDISKIPGLEEIAAFEKRLEQEQQKESPLPPKGRVQGSPYVMPAVFGALVTLAATIVLTVLLLPSWSALRLRDGGRSIAVLASGQITGLDDVPVSLRQEASEALEGGLPTSPLWGELARVVSETRGDGQPRSTVLIDPVETAIRGDQPTFAWTPLAGSDRYRVEVRDTDGTIVASGETTKTTWTVSSRLHPGSIYYWQLTARQGGREFVAPRRGERPAVFKVLDVDSLIAVEEEEAKARDSVLVRMVIYWKAGLFHEAERMAEQLRRENPGSKIVQTLAEQIQARATDDR